MANENQNTTRTGTAESALLLTTIEAAGELAISKRGIQDLVSARKIGFIKFGRNIRFHRDDIAAFVEANRCRPVGWKLAAVAGTNREARA